MSGNHAVAAFTVLTEGMPDVNAITDVMARLSGTHPVFTPRLTSSRLSSGQSMKPGHSTKSGLKPTRQGVHLDTLVTEPVTGQYGA